MIFKTAEKLVDEKTGEIELVSQPFWIANQTQAETKKFNQTEELKANINTLNEVVKINERYRQGEIELEAAISARSKALEGCSDEVKTFGNSSELTADQIDVWSRKQEKQIEASDKAKKGFKNLGKEMSAATKSMLGSMGIDLAAAALMSFAKWGFDTLNEKYGLTKSARAAHMEETLNTYNDAIEETESNLQSINSVADEFNKLSAGVGVDGKNISLSADEYSRYNEIVSELVTLNPSLVEGYTTEGNAIVNKTTALQDCIKAQEDYKKSATETYIANGSDIIQGAADNIAETKGELDKTVEKVSKSIGGATKRKGNKKAGTRANFEKIEKNDVISEVVGKDVNIADASVQDLKKIAQCREDILATTIEQNQWDKNNVEDQKKINSLNEDLLAISTYYNELESASQPTLDWLNTYVSQMNKAGEFAASDSESILSTVPESLRAGYQAALKEISMDTSLTAGEMKVQATSVAETLSKIYNYENVEGISTSARIEVDGEEKIISYKQAVKEAAEAKDEFDNSLGDSTAVSEYNKSTETQVETLNSLADKWDEVDETISASLRAQASEIEDYASENALTLEKALNPLNEYISTARTAAKSLKENWEENVVGNDVNTAINAYESIYDEVMDGFDNAGNGTNAFWTAAAEFLGTDTLEEYGYDIDKVNKKMKSLSGVMGDSEQNSWNFFKMLKNNKDTLNELIVDEDGNFKEIVEIADNGAISFDIDSGDIDEVADALNISRNLLVSLIDNARHWSNIDLSNGDEVETAIREMDSTWEDGSGTAYQFQDSIVEAADAAGLSVSEVYKKMKDLNDVKILDLSKFDNEDTIGEIAQDFIEMNSILGQKDGSDGFKMNANAIISQMNAMGRSADETTNILEKLEEQGWIDDESLGNKGNQSWSEYVEPKFDTLDESDPFSKMANSVDKIVYGIDAIIVALGGIPTNLNFDTNLDEIEHDIADLGTANSYTEDQKNAIQDKINSQESYYKDILKNAVSQGNKQVANRAKNAISELGTLQQKLDELDEEKTIKIKTEVEKPENLTADITSPIDSGSPEKPKATTVEAPTIKSPTLDEIERDGIKISAKVEVDDKDIPDDYEGTQYVEVEREPISTDAPTATQDVAIGSEELPSLKKPTALQDVAIGSEELPSLKKPTALQDVALGNVEEPKKNYSATLSISATITGLSAKIREFLNMAKGTTSSPNYRPNTSIPSMASGGKRGRLGPNGNGGLTLTGELGTELVWIPSESRSFLVGMYGPEMVNLPGDAVVYPADQTRKIIGDTIHPSRMNFGTGSMAKGNMNFGSMLKGDMTYSGSSSSSSSSKNNNSGSSSKKTSNSKNSKSSDSNKKSAYEKGKEKLDHQLEMGYITEVQYYKKLKALYNKHKKSLKKNTEDHRKALEDKRQAYIDAYEHEKEILDSQLKRGIISETTYYKKLAALGKKYYTKNGKIRKGFADEWRDWQEDLISAGKDSFDDGMDDLNKKLEDGLITFEKYYKEYLKLKNKYLKTDDDKKDSLEDAKDQLDDYVGDVLDDIEQNIDDGELGLDWGIDKAAGLAQMQTLIKQIEKIKNKYPEMADACDKAIKEIKRTMKELEKEQFEDEQDKLEEYMDLVEDMLRQEAEDYMDALEDQADAFDDLIDKRKEMLKLAEDEAEFMENLEDNGNEMAKIQKQIDDLSRDDSRAAQARLAELQEELAELQKDRTSTIRDETISKTEDLLDEQSEFYREIIDRQIEVVENWLNNKSAVIEVVIEQIENRDENDLYDRLIAYNGEFGDALVGTVADAWEDIETLTEKYGDDIATIVEILQKGIDINVHSGFISSSQTDYAETQEKTKTHHTGLASGFTGDGATLKQNEVWRLLTDDELVLNKEDQMKLGASIRNYNLIQDAYSGLLKSISEETSSVMPNIEITIDSPITIEGTATPEVVEQLNQYGDQLATQTLDKLEAALLRNGIRTRAISNSRKL